MGLIALTIPLVAEFDGKTYPVAIGPPHTMFALAVMICWFVALRIQSRFVIRAPLVRLLLQTVIVPGVIANALLTAGLVLLVQLEIAHLLSPGNGTSVPQGWLWLLPVGAGALLCSMSYGVAQCVAPPDRPEADQEDDDQPFGDPEPDGRAEEIEA